MNEVLENEINKNTYFSNDIEINPAAISQIFDEKDFGFVKALKSTKRCSKFKNVFLPTSEENKIVKQHYHSTGKHRGLAHNECFLNTRKTHSSFLPILLLQFFRI